MFTWREKAENWLNDTAGYAPDTSVEELAGWMEKARKWDLVFDDIQEMGFVGTAENLKQLKEKAEKFDALKELHEGTDGKWVESDSIRKGVKEILEAS